MTITVYKKEADLRAQLIAVLQSCNCPHPANQAWDGITIGECVERDECGCDAGNLIKKSQRIAS